MEGEGEDGGAQEREVEASRAGAACGPVLLHEGVEQGAGDVGVVGQPAGWPFGDGQEALAAGAESAQSVGELDEEEDVAEELQGRGLWRVRGRVGVCGLGDGCQAESNVAGSGVHALPFRDERAPFRGRHGCQGGAPRSWEDEVGERVGLRYICCGQIWCGQRFGGLDGRCRVEYSAIRRGGFGRCFGHGGE